MVDNGSTKDESAKLLPGEFPAVRFILNDDNRGFSAACNYGLAVARGEYVLLLNNDTILIEDASFSGRGVSRSTSGRRGPRSGI